MHYTADEIIEELGLKPLEGEGGWFKLKYTSDINVPKSMLPIEFSDDRACASQIYYLLKKGEVSKLHMLLSDELWFWLSGGTLKMTTSDSEDLVNQKITIIGSNIVTEELSHLVTRKTWQTSEVISGDYVLVACVVIPGFRNEDYFEKGEWNV